jgi:hypothetical protein
VVCWGHGREGQLGHGGPSSHAPTAVLWPQ